MFKTKIKNYKILISGKAEVFKKGHKIKFKYPSYIKMEIIKIRNKQIKIMASPVFHKTLISL